MAGAGRNFAVVGGGFAGCAVAWHLLAAARARAPIAVTLFDGAGLGGGASGAAAGLLHPFTPRGRVRGGSWCILGIFRYLLSPLYLRCGDAQT